MNELQITQGLAFLFANPFVGALLILVAVIIGQIIVNRMLAQVVPRIVTDKNHPNKKDEEKREQTLLSIFRTGAGFIIWVVGILLILAQLNVNIAALATGAGLIGIVVGFGAQKLIQDFLAGIFIVLEHQYRVGDFISLNAGGVEILGTVEDFTVRITRLRDLDGNLHIISNGAAVTATNYTVKFGNVNVDVLVSYDADIDQVEKTINRVGKEQAKTGKWKDDIIEPVEFMRVNSLDDSGVSVKAFGKVKAGEQWNVAGDFRRRIKRAFEEDKINIPYQQIVIHQASPQKEKRQQ